MRIIRKVINMFRHKKNHEDSSLNQQSGRETRKYYCIYCRYSWESDEEYSYCPLCAAPSVRSIEKKEDEFVEKGEE